MGVWVNFGCILGQLWALKFARWVGGKRYKVYTLIDKWGRFVYKDVDCGGTTTYSSVRLQWHTTRRGYSREER